MIFTRYSNCVFTLTRSITSMVGADMPRAMAKDLASFSACWACNSISVDDNVVALSSSLSPPPQQEQHTPMIYCIIINCCSKITIDTTTTNIGVRDFENDRLDPGSALAHFMACSTDKKNSNARMNTVDIDRSFDLWNYYLHLFTR